MDDQSSLGSFVDHGLEAEINKESRPQWSVEGTDVNVRGEQGSSGSNNNNKKKTQNKNNHSNNNNNNNDDDDNDNDRFGRRGGGYRNRYRLYGTTNVRGVGTRSSRLLWANRRLEGANAALEKVNRGLLESNRLLAHHYSALADAVAALTREQSKGLLATEELRQQVQEIKTTVQLLVQRGEKS
ncbi:hypothetical protein LSM04_007569 [Trypanosoma melophagium]|uniref:uncharacterized protein n=1 Tax=Trypanosoma melophagium TaxID=715481 RepID=UPI003519EF74|nr:hypothetical protein LSM04_007569 [Trypanosoma melophagium]